MRCGILQGAVVLALLGVAVGCGGGEGGPRGATGGQAGAGGGGAMTQSPPSMRTVVYVPSYNGKLSNWTTQLQFAHVNYVNLSFAEVDAAGNVRYPDPGMASFVQRAHESSVKVCVAIGGATTINDGGVFATLLQDANRPAFIDKLVAFVNDNQLDCLDVDLEGNGVNEYYEAFVTELANRLKPQGKELTAAVAAWFGDKITANALAQFDFINVMAYDLYYERNTPMQWSSVEAATAEVEKWVTERGVPRDRVVYGVPFYGIRWPAAGGAPEIMGYSTLLRLDSTVTTSDQLQRDGNIIYLNSRATIQAKAVLAKTYGGIMAWELSQDATGDASLLKAIRDAVP
jgi:GH18 family chitinase